MKISFTIIFCCVVFLNVSGIFAVKEGTNGKIRTFFWYYNESKLYFLVKGGLDVKETIEKFLKDLQTKIPEVFTFADQNFTLPNNKYVT